MNGSVRVESYRCETCGGPVVIVEQEPMCLNDLPAGWHYGYQDDGSVVVSPPLSCRPTSAEVTE